MKDQNILIDAQKSSPQQPTDNHTTQNSRLNRWLPTPGNMIFTLLIVSMLFWAQNAGALPMRSPTATSSSTISYQGRLAERQPADGPIQHRIPHLQRGDRWLAPLGRVLDRRQLGRNYRRTL